MKFKTTDHVTLDYDDEGSGTPVIILTGIGGSRQIWQHQVKRLVDAGYRVINVDARNQGASQRTAKGLRISRHAMDIHNLITKLNLENPILMGNSMGAATFFAYVSLFGDQQIRAIIDVDQSPKMINDETWSDGFHELTWGTFPDLLKFPLGPATKMQISDDLYQAVQRANQAHPYDPDLNYAFLVDHAFQDWRDVVRQLNVPLLVVAGKKSPYFNPDFAAKTAAMAKLGESKAVEGCGHIVMAEQPEIFDQLMLDFLAQVSAK